MIISIERKFIFIANLKTASTSIEDALRPWGDIVVRRSELGKHLPFHEIQKRFSWVFNVIKEEDFVKFGVIRDPVGYALSQYKSHTHEKFKNNTKLYTGDMDFDTFLNEWCVRNKDQMQPQSNKFKNVNGDFCLDFLIRYENLERDFDSVMNQLNISNINLPKLNTSPSVEVEISNSNLLSIKKIFDEDYDFISRMCR